MTTYSKDWSSSKGRGLCYVAEFPFVAGENTLPTSSELDRITKEENKVLDAIKDADCELIGHVMEGGVMLSVMATRKRPPGEVKIKTGLFKSQVIRLQACDEKRLKWIRESFTPTRRECAMSANRPLLNTLKQHRDDPRKKRSVEFAARFGSAEARADFIKSVEAHGFRLTQQPTWEPAPDDFWCEIERETSIEEGVIADVCCILEEIAESNGGEFDGWQSPICE